MTYQLLGEFPVVEVGSGRRASLAWHPSEAIDVIEHAEYREVSGVVQMWPGDGTGVLTDAQFTNAGIMVLLGQLHGEPVEVRVAQFDGLGDSA